MAMETTLLAPANIDRQPTRIRQGGVIRHALEPICAGGEMAAQPGEQPSVVANFLVRVGV
jgi:hypothetical protein